MAEKYRLLKNTLNAQTGDIFERLPASLPAYFYCALRGLSCGSQAINDAEWFEPVEQRWKPNPSQTYFWVDVDGRVIEDRFSSAFDRERYVFGNCFRTKADAELAADKVRECLMQFHKEFSK